MEEYLTNLRENNESYIDMEIAGGLSLSDLGVPRSNHDSEKAQIHHEQTE